MGGLLGQCLLGNSSTATLSLGSFLFDRAVALRLGLADLSLALWLGCSRMSLTLLALLALVSLL